MLLSGRRFRRLNEWSKRLDTADETQSNCKSLFPTLSLPTPESLRPLRVRLMSTPYTYLSFEEDELLRPLAAQLFPPADSARDYLVRDALGALVISQATLDRTHAYQFIEFRDQRKLEAALTSYDAQLGKSRAIPKLEMTRSQVEDIKRFRRSIKEANKEADKEWDEPLVPSQLFRPLIRTPCRELIRTTHRSWLVASSPLGRLLPDS